MKLLVLCLAALTGACTNTPERVADRTATPPPPVPQGVPTTLFEVELGGVYDFGESGEGVGNLPASKFAGMQKFLGEGVHFYFQPRIENQSFPYLEHRTKPDDKYFKTSYRLYLLPVIPASTTTLQELEELTPKWQVATIEWSGDAKDKSDGYVWASEICKTFSADISTTPAIVDDYNDEYTCTFSADDREFKVTSRYGKTVTLTYNQKSFEEKNSTVETTRRKLEAEKIRPYR